MDWRPSSSLVIGASGGVGSALAENLMAFGPVRGLSRTTDDLDITDEQSVSNAAGALAACRYDLIIIATGALAADGARPEKSFRDISAGNMARLFVVNAVGPALIVKYFAPLLADTGKSVLAFLSARVGSIGDNRLGGWMSYRASKAALNQVVRCAAIEIGRSRPEAIVLALHPGTIETDLTRDYARGRFTATPARCAASLVRVCSQAVPDMSGGFYAYDGSRIDW
jgi:NAD(P)-dependent dehydrogenase (short-subunit alcohol dehydrogenase family)